MSLKPNVAYLVLRLLRVAEDVHVFRNRFGRALDPRWVRGFLGHSGITTTERYLHTTAHPEDVDGDPELVEHQEAILRAVGAPAAVHPGRATNERWYFLRGAGPSRWLHVVVANEGDRGRIVTAFGPRRDR